ncbi:hypothetical protein CTI14_49760, partial [Methylobacterium radiotolerans]
PFQARFPTLDEYARTLYLVLVVIAAIALLVVLTPLSVHRWLFRKQVKDRLVASGAWAAKVALGLAALLIMGTSSLIFDVVLGRWQSLVAGGVPFQARFPTLDEYARTLYLVLVVIAAIALLVVL